MQGILVPITGLVLLGSPGVLSGATFPPQRPESQWVWMAKDGKLSYKSLPAGDRIMDFSSAGYGSGGVAIPIVPAEATLSPSGRDDTAAIQEALNRVSRLVLVSGFRGAVLLKPGVFHCERGLTISAGGVVLRGSGSGRSGTIINMTGASHVCISVSGPRSSGNAEAGKPTNISDAYVASGATAFHVADASDFRPGDTIVIRRPVTEAWINLMGMDTLVRNGRKETWLSDRSEIETERVIREISGNRIGIDIPLTDSFDSRYINPPGASVVKIASPSRISNVGVESLRIVSPPQAVTIDDRHNQAIRLNEVNDGWLRDIAIEDTVNSVSIGASARRITVQEVNLTHSVPTKGAAKPADFTAGGSQVLFDRCSASGDNIFYFVTGARATGPIVLLNCAFYGDGHIQPHARWATGLLVDNCHVPASGIDFMNRGEMGSGHGWTIGWAVAWNCVAKSYVIQQPPGSANWAIGCKGNPETSGMAFGHEPALPAGILDSQGTPVTPASLYLAQLRERLGPQALENIGY
ncbi:MAG TPA: hypothetical protein VN281_24075 [Verrucomicrobiae bacterium]|nr:hypothetical protein [Verrucomicrobiae bacterium]